MVDIDQIPQDQAERIADALEGDRDALETIAELDETFAERAENALAFIDAVRKQQQEVADAE